jgi:hypothetical protein
MAIDHRRIHGLKKEQAYLALNSHFHSTLLAKDFHCSICYKVGRVATFMS